MTSTRSEQRAGIGHRLALRLRHPGLGIDPNLIHQASCGLPRAINNLAIQALVAAYATNNAIVDESSARAAIAEVMTE